jgi:UDP-N-acetyl-D-glucosamine dehydrogenase
MTNPNRTQAVGSSSGAAALIRKIRDRSARVGVVGMGYVGVPTMVAAAQAGFSVVGVDTSEERASQINAGQSYIEDVKSAILEPLVSQGLVSATTDYTRIKDLDVILVCVPTPITELNEPDLVPMEGAVSGLAENLGQQQLVIFQSTTYPGHTEESVLPALESHGHKVGQDFYLAFALERIDPGNRDFMVRDLPKVLGGITKSCAEVSSVFFEAFVDNIYVVSAPKVAEMTKLLENTFRSVNIALVNELSMLCNRMDIDIWEVVEAASTKPFGYMPFFPGPGVGGHCIPVDPFYLSWKAKEYNFRVNFIHLAAETNDYMPHYTLSRISEIMSDHDLALSGAKVLVLGVTFKADVDDTRNSPALKVLELLIKNGADVSYLDQHAPTIMVNDTKLTSVQLNPEAIQEFDACVIMVNHENSDLKMVVKYSTLVIDGQNATKGMTSSTNIAKI